MVKGSRPFSGVWESPIEDSAARGGLTEPNQPVSGKHLIVKKKMVGRPRLELGTNRLKARCSTN